MARKNVGKKDLSKEEKKKELGERNFTTSPKYQRLQSIHVDSYGKVIYLVSAPKRLSASCHWNMFFYSNGL